MQHEGWLFELHATVHCYCEKLKTPPIESTIGEAIFSHGRSHAVLVCIVDFSDAEHNRRRLRKLMGGAAVIASFLNKFAKQSLHGIHLADSFTIFPYRTSLESRLDNSDIQFIVR